MLLTLEQAEKLRWMKVVPNTYPRQMYHYVSDGTETKEDIQYMINWANTWSELYGYQIVDNYLELLDAKENL